MKKTIAGVEYETFPEGKTITELGIDTTRKSIVVNDVGIFNKGDILALLKDDNSNAPYFKRISDGMESYCHLYRLAYYEPNKHTYQKGDRVVCVNADDLVSVGMTGTFQIVTNYGHQTIKWDNFAGKGHSGSYGDETKSCRHMYKREIAPPSQLGWNHTERGGERESGA